MPSIDWLTGLPTSVRLALYYRLVATVSFIIGGGVAIAGIWLGLGTSFVVFFGNIQEPDVWDRMMAVADIQLTILLVTVGVIIWQVGKAAAFYWTFTEALQSGSQDS